MTPLKKKAALLLLLALFCSFIFNGCHGSKGLNEFRVPEEFDTSAEYEITFWAKNDTNKNQTRIYSQAIEDFEALYPNIKVNLRLYTDYGKIYNDVITNISTMTTPNVCITYPDHIATYKTGNNVVAELDALISDEKYGLGGSGLSFESPSKEEIIPQFLNECSLDGHIYALPFMRSTEACYVNKTYLEAMGYTLPECLTWDFVWEVSEAAMAKDEDGMFLVNGQKVMIPFIYKSTDNMMIQLLRQKRAGYSTPEGEILLFNDTTKQLLLTIAKHAKNGAFSTFKISSYPGNFLNAGQCIFAVDSTAGSTWMGYNAPLSDICSDKLVEFETAVLPVPQFDPDNMQMISQGPSICIFNKEDPQEVLASWLFAQFLLTNGVQTAYSQTEGYIPVTSVAQDSEEYTDYLSRGGEDNTEHYDVKIKAAKLLINNTGNTFITPVFNGSASLRDAAGQLIENTVKSVRRKETVDEKYIDALFDDVASLYRLDSLAGRAGSAVLSDNTGKPLPKASAVLLASLAVVWLMMAVYAVFKAIKRLQNKQ